MMPFIYGVVCDLTPEMEEILPDADDDDFFPCFFLPSLPEAGRFFDPPPPPPVTPLVFLDAGMREKDTVMVDKRWGKIKISWL